MSKSNLRSSRNHHRIVMMICWCQKYQSFVDTIQVSIKQIIDTSTYKIYRTIDWNHPLTQISKQMLSQIIHCNWFFVLWRLLVKGRRRMNGLAFWHVKWNWFLLSRSYFTKDVFCFCHGFLVLIKRNVIRLFKDYSKTIQILFNGNIYLFSVSKKTCN